MKSSKKKEKIYDFTIGDSDKYKEIKTRINNFTSFFKKFLCLLILPKPNSFS